MGDINHINLILCFIKGFSIFMNQNIWVNAMETSIKLHVLWIQWSGDHWKDEDEVTASIILASLMNSYFSRVQKCVEGAVGYRPQNTKEKSRFHKCAGRIIIYAFLLPTQLKYFYDFSICLFSQ